MTFPITEVRTMFPSLDVTDNGTRRIYFDNPAGTQVSRKVIDAVSNVYLHHNSNSGAFNSTSVEVEALAARTYNAIATLLNAPDPDEVIIGPNMTTLTYHLAHCLAHRFSPGDEIIVTRMDHEGNVSPWLQMAEDRQLTVRWLPFNRESWRIEPEDLTNLLSERTKFLALNYASNLTGAINDAAALTTIAKSVGALVYVDGVQYTPHQLVDVQALGCDFFACSSYKFFGPHLGVVWGRRDLLDQLHAYKCRCVSDQLPDRFVTGTQQFELIAGLLATVDYLDDLGHRVGGSGDRRALIKAAYHATNYYEGELSDHFLDGLADIPGITLHGPARTNQVHGRVPTFSFTHESLPSSAIASALSDEGIFCHWGHNYAYEVAKTLGLDPVEGAVRVGFAHYNTVGEVDALLESLRRNLQQ